MATKRRSSGSATKKAATKKEEAPKKATEEAPKKKVSAKRTPSPAAAELAKNCKHGEKNHLELCVAYLRKNKKANQEAVDCCAASLKKLRAGKKDRNAGSIKMSLVNILTAAKK
jgi:hypothetical protein